MRRVFKLEKITGIVALAYLVVIPVAGYALYRKIESLDADVVYLYGDTPGIGSRFSKDTEYHAPV